MPRTRLRINAKKLYHIEIKLAIEKQLVLELKAEL